MGGMPAERSRPHPLLLLGLFAGAALVSGFTIRRGGAPFDEGLVLQAARRVAEGQVPYSDFQWAYGPAHPYLLGAWFKLFGGSLLSWRVLRVACDAGVAVAVYVLARRQAPPWLALVAWLTAACAMAQPTSAIPFPFALLFVLIALAVATREPQGRWTPLAAGLATTVAAAWRLDFALYGVAAVAVAVLLRRAPRPDRLRGLGGYLATFGVTTLVLYLPFAIATGPADLYDALIGTTLRERDYWTLPFPVTYHGPLSLWPPGDLLRDGKDLLGYEVPLALVVGLVLAAAALLLRFLRERHVPSLWGGLFVLGIGDFLYLRSRSDEFHVTPLLVTLAALLPAAAWWAWRAYRGRPLAGLLGAVLALLLLYGVANRLSALVLPPRLASLDLPVADGAKVPPAEARALPHMVREVQRRVPPGDPIYAVTLRSDLVRFNQPLIYVLTERDNPTSQDFGIQTGAGAQRRIVGTLRRVRPRVVVRWTDPTSVRREQNLRGRPSGSRLLDHWLAARYRRVASYGSYEILAPRGGG
jgi:dolichyl-phosphate-mannose-protein mannosyltransferase